ncbi:MAG TPA: glycosyltransferase, partial [Acidimicrobiales bacterium]|nr:glycosyltransferase [Acidimicrobiales bacterium]
PDRPVPDEVEAPEHVTVLRPGTNTGFAGGCNLAIAALDGASAVMLLNNDAVLDGDGIERLVDRLREDVAIGAVVPKVVFEGRFHELEVEAAATWRPGRGDDRELAWQPRRIEVGGEDVTDRCQLVQGFWEPGRGGRWAGERALLRVPAIDGATTVRIQLATPPRQVVELTVNGRHTAWVAPGVGWAEVALDDEPATVIANVGNVRRADGYGLDVGRFEADRGQHDEAREVEAWCGGAVVLRDAYLRDVGPFDERLFLYYEDLELSLRGAARGWRFVYEPSVLVEHRVGSAAGADASRSERLKERNRLLVLARHGSLRRLLVELVRFVGVTLAYARREILAPPLRGEAPCGWLVKVRGLALGGVLAGLPGMLRSRWEDRRAR